MSISNANPSVATFTRYRYVAVGAETSISGADANGNVMSYSPGREQVYLNGTMLVRASDYAATTGSSITDLTALVENDVVEVLAFTSFAVAAGVAQDEAPSSPAEGQLWLDTNGTVPGVQITRWSKAPSTGATSLSGNDDNSLPLAYTAGYETVYRNGVLLSRGNDYTATDGTSITLIDATLAGDIIEVFGPSAIGFADTYTQSQANSTFIAKSLTTTTGDIIYASAANTPARLGIGSTDQVLKVSGGIPAWATPAAGGMTLLQTLTLSGSSTTSSSIAGTFTNLYIVVKNGVASTGGDLFLRFNGDTSANYVRTCITVDTPSTGIFAGNGTTMIILSDIGTDSTSTGKATGSITVNRYADTDQTFVTANFYCLEGRRKGTYINAIYDQSAAISTLTIGVTNGTVTGEAYIYGVN